MEQIENNFYVIGVYFYISIADGILRHNVARVYQKDGIRSIFFSKIGNLKKEISNDKQPNWVYEYLKSDTEDVVSFLLSKVNATQIFQDIEDCDPSNMQFSTDKRLSVQEQNEIKQGLDAVELKLRTLLTRIPSMNSQVYQDWYTSFIHHYHPTY